jgi:hypothetical protein
MMRRRLLGVFNSIDDAKHALGQIKKESWNQAEFVVIVGEPDGNRRKEGNNHFEMAVENFITGKPPETGRWINHIWPGLKEVELAGVGTVNVGYSAIAEEIPEPSWDRRFSETDIQVMEREISANKIVALIEVEEQFLPKLRLIMDTNGAELIEQNQPQ